MLTAAYDNGCCQSIWSCVWCDLWLWLNLFEDYILIEINWRTRGILNDERSNILFIYVVMRNSPYEKQLAKPHRKRPLYYLLRNQLLFPFDQTPVGGFVGYHFSKWQRKRKKNCAQILVRKMTVKCAMCVLPMTQAEQHERSGSQAFVTPASRTHLNANIMVDYYRFGQFVFFFHFSFVILPVECRIIPIFVALEKNLLNNSSAPETVKWAEYRFNGRSAKRDELH